MGPQDGRQGTARHALRRPRVIFGAPDPKGGAAGGAMNLLQFPTLNHKCTITSGVRSEECRNLLRTFFAEQRAKKKTFDKLRTEIREIPSALESPRDEEDFGEAN